jgi:putative ABC transport system permease protein
LQGSYLANGLVITDVPEAVRALCGEHTNVQVERVTCHGAARGDTGLGVVMTRSVRERRRTIGVLRAWGAVAHNSTSSRREPFIALEGVAVGTLLGILTTWLLYRNSPAFGSLDVAFPIAWPEITLTVGVAFAASFLATLIPARRAAAVRPALAFRVTD